MDCDLSCSPAHHRCDAVLLARTDHPVIESTTAERNTGAFEGLRQTVERCTVDVLAALRPAMRAFPSRLSTAANCAITSATLGSPVRFILVLNLNRYPTSTAQFATRAVDLQSSAVEKNMHWPVRSTLEVMRLVGRLPCSRPTAQGGMIGDSERQAHQGQHRSYNPST